MWALIVSCPLSLQAVKEFVIVEGFKVWERCCWKSQQKKVVDKKCAFHRTLLKKVSTDSFLNTGNNFCRKTAPYLFVHFCIYTAARSWLPL